VSFCHCAQWYVGRDGRVDPGSAFRIADDAVFDLGVDQAYAIFFQDTIDLIEIGRVDLQITATLPGGGTGDTGQ